ncbi:MAG: lysozyme [Mesorhizobium sp.]|uniref:lysozyme n=1 Tax=Mesorhizobium sp. TaxID=1871066 RepID=UPI0011FE1ABA|nr:lysozyme [Mesorhizobium sp.]TIN82742.1 MAG: lysozyme [Mesorhizobium sp.]TIN88327.1 MAG: lysozyme [Mesorhizobium sp.]
MSRIKKGGALAASVVALVSGFEGLRTYAYRDPVGIPTICFGETRGVKMGDHKTPAECKDMLISRLAEFETGMRKCLASPDTIPDNAYAAFLSASYNIGTGAFCKSSMARRANAGDIRGACDALLAWDKAGGFRLPGLTKRRAKERELCLRGI